LALSLKHHASSCQHFLTTAPSMTCLCKARCTPNAPTSLPPIFCNLCIPFTIHALLSLPLDNRLILGFLGWVATRQLQAQICTALSMSGQGHTHTHKHALARLIHPLSSDAPNQTGVPKGWPKQASSGGGGAAGFAGTLPPSACPAPKMSRRQKGQAEAAGVSAPAPTTCGSKVPMAQEQHWLAAV